MCKNKNNSSTIHDLSQELLEWLRMQSYSVDHLNRHRQVANRVGKFMATNGIGAYSEKVGDMFLEDYFSKRKVCSQHKKRMFMVVQRLNDFANGKIPPLRRTNPSYRESLTDHFSEILRKYLEGCGVRGNKASTIGIKSKFCGNFLLHLAKQGCFHINEITPEQIGSACLKFSNKNAWDHVRMLLKFAYANSYAGRDYSSLVPRYRKPFVMPSVYTEDEIRRLEAAIDRKSKTGIRDCAMLLLVMRYGLRAGDIIKLSFRELDFNCGHIRLTQEKTGEPWEGKMLPEVREALQDYIINARPKIASDAVFLLVRAPYRGVGNSSLREAMKRYFLAAGIDPGDRKRGPHALRSSLASSMVNDSVPYEVVRKVLGHADPNAIKHYAKVDIDRLREYAIPVPAPAGVFHRFLSGEVQI